MYVLGRKESRTSDPIVRKKIILKTEKFRDRNRSMLFREHGVKQQKSVKRGQKWFSLGRGNGRKE